MTQPAFSPVQNLVERYFDGLHDADASILRSVFHPRAIYVSADESPMLHRTMEEYFAVVEARQAPSQRGERRRDHIDSVEFAGERTALARVRCSIGSKDFVDLLTLIFVEERWQIISKVFQIIERNNEKRA
ncbi:MAG: hypothetical protein ACI9KE_001049 [Polyangiales bacterium]|jgi:hypothetical protein